MARFGPTLLLSVVLVATSAAGCLDRAGPAEVASDVGPDGAAPTPAGGGGPSSAAAGSTETADPSARPEWSVGHYWTFTFAGGDGATKSTLVVIGADGSGYDLASTSEETATYDAFEDISFVGRVTRDLAGRQGDDSVKFYQWPLVDGASWTTSWDGRDVTLTAAADPAVPTPTGPEEGFTITGVVGEEPFVTYNFAPSVGWWTRIDWGDYGMDLVEHGVDYSGTYFVGELTTLVEQFASMGPALPPTHSWTVEGAPAVLRADFHAVAMEPGVFAVEIHDPEGMAAVTTTGSCDPTGDVCAVFESWDLPIMEGEWQAATFAGFNGPAFFRVRAVYLTEATLGGADSEDG